MAKYESATKKNVAPVTTPRRAEAAPSASPANAQLELPFDTGLPARPPGGGGFGGVVNATVNGVAAASIGLGAVRDLHEGHPAKAAGGLGLAAVVIVVSKKAPIVGTLLTVGLWGRDVLSSRDEIAQSAADFAYEHISDDHPYIGATVAAGHAVKQAVFDRFFKPIGTDIGEGLAAGLLELTDSDTAREMVKADLMRQRMGIPRFRH
jgi:hypothetical protein